MDFYGKPENGDLIFSPEQTERRRQYLTSFKPNVVLKDTITKYRQPKTVNQVKMIFGNMIEQTIAQANDLGIDVSYLLKYLLDDRIPKGQGLTKDFLHELMYVICPTTDEDGKRVTLSKMDTIEAAKLFDRFRDMVAPLGIVIPEPDKNWRKK
jgi:hypothetical protein